MQRREFLSLCGAAGLGFAEPVGMSLVSRAEAAKADPSNHEGPYYVVFNAAGGWDTTHLMDPKGVNQINRLASARKGDLSVESVGAFLASKRIEVCLPCGNIYCIFI